MFKDLPERFTKKIKSLAPDDFKEEIHLITSPERQNSARIGGNILSSISTFNKMWIKKDEYEESGFAILEK